MIIFIVLLVLSAASKVIMDLSSIGALPWNPDFWDKARGWRRKWKDGDPNKGEAFLGSSTIFVFVTDGWHLAQFFFLNLLFAAFLPFVIWWKVLIARAVFGLTFEALYRVLKK